MLTAVRRRLSLWIERAVIEMAERRDLHGIVVAVIPSKTTDAENLFTRIDAALQLLGRAQARRLKQARRHFDVILVRRYSLYRAAYAHQLRACILDSDFVADRAVAPQQIAGSIVHETTHARLEQLGMRYDWSNRGRIERLCRRAELDFGHHLDDGAAVIARAAEHLALDDATLASSPETQRIQLGKAAERDLGDIYMPAPVRKFFLWVLRRRAVYPALAADGGVRAAPAARYIMLWGLRGCRRTPPQQKRRALGSLARSPREPPRTRHSRFEDVVGSAPRAPPPGDPPARAAGIPVPRLRRAVRGGLAPLPALGPGGGPAGSRRWAPRCRRAQAPERGASPTEVGAAPPPASGEAPLAGALPCARRRRRRAGPGLRHHPATHGSHASGAGRLAT